MTLSSPTATHATTASGAPGRPAESPEEAARQFEAVLVRQFVEVMTQDLFDGDAEGGLSGQADLQRDTLTDTLTDHLVESGTFGVAKLMIDQWKRSGRIPDSDATPAAPPTGGTDWAPNPSPAISEPSEPAGTRPMTLEDALRRYPLTESTRPAQGRPVSSDHPHAPVP